MRYWYAQCEEADALVRLTDGEVRTVLNAATGKTAKESSSIGLATGTESTHQSLRTWCSNSTRPEERMTLFNNDCQAATLRDILNLWEIRLSAERRLERASDWMRCKVTMVLGSAIVNSGTYIGCIRLLYSVFGNRRFAERIRAFPQPGIHDTLSAGSEVQEIEPRESGCDREMEPQSSGFQPLPQS